MAEVFAMRWKGEKIMPGEGGGNLVRGNGAMKEGVDVGRQSADQFLAYLPVSFIFHRAVYAQLNRAADSCEGAQQLVKILHRRNPRDEGHPQMSRALWR